MFRWSWIEGNHDVIAQQLVQHIELTGGALGFGMTIAFPLALAARRWPRLHGPALGLAGVAFTIPSLALFILLIPFTGLSMATSLIGLTLYTLLILFRNTVAAFDGVPSDVVEAARAMGYTRTRRLLTVELPLALPVIMAGIRIATVTALIGQGGLGQLFITGFTLQFPTPLLVGFVLSVALAVAADLALAGVLGWLTPWRRGRA
ncbi:MAG: quaternary ammonium transporter [Proteobacteria bacterium SW_6_67_9]|nr:MAG: quaternary ammonium transporter [Proteobacteria bacterium SW_6_67_9]